MKKFISIVCIIFSITAAGLIGCDKKTHSSGPTHGYNIDQEAVDIAKQIYFSKIIIECGGFTYKRTNEYANGGQHFRVKDKGTYTVTSQALSEADKMNGYEWKGTVSFDAKGPSQELNLWTNGVEYRDRWTDMPIYSAANIQKMNGKWGLAGYVPGFAPSLKQISCEEVHR